MTIGATKDSSCGEGPGALPGLLNRWQGGDQDALDQLMPLAVDQLRQLARFVMDREQYGHTLQPTALVNELYLHLRSRRSVSWRNPDRFLGYCVRVLRRILIDYSRRRFADKRDRARTVSLEGARVPPIETEADLMALEEALQALASHDARLCQVVEYRFLLGLTEEETAQLLGVSSRTVRRDWHLARLWLKRALRP